MSGFSSSLCAPVRRSRTTRLRLRYLFSAPAVAARARLVHVIRVLNVISDTNHIDGPVTNSHRSEFGCRRTEISRSRGVEVAKPGSLRSPGEFKLRTFGPTGLRWLLAVQWESVMGQIPLHPGGHGLGISHCQRLGCHEHRGSSGE